MTEQRIKYLTKPDVLREMSQNCIKRFNEVVDFDRDFIEVKKFMEDLV